jgi:hypothetical protein
MGQRGATTLKECICDANACCFRYQNGGLRHSIVKLSHFLGRFPATIRRCSGVAAASVSPALICLYLMVDLLRSRHRRTSVIFIEYHIIAKIFLQDAPINRRSLAGRPAKEERGGKE